MKNSTFKASILFLFFFLMVVPANATIIIPPSHDSCVDSSNRGNVLGNETYLLVNEGHHTTFINYDLSGFLQNRNITDIHSAKLNLFIKTVTRPGPVLVMISKLGDSYTWDESTLTYQNAPTTQRKIPTPHVDNRMLLGTIDLTEKHNGTRISIDVTGHLRRYFDTNSLLTFNGFQLNGNAAVEFYSKEALSNTQNGPHSYLAPTLELNAEYWQVCLIRLGLRTIL